MTDDVIYSKLIFSKKNTVKTIFSAAMTSWIGVTNQLEDTTFYCNWIPESENDQSPEK